MRADYISIKLTLEEEKRFLSFLTNTISESPNTETAGDFSFTVYTFPKWKVLIFANSAIETRTVIFCYQHKEIFTIDIQIV
jgi:hypothetical protein